MISFIRGTIKELDENVMVVDVGGVGFGLQVPTGCAASVGAQITIHTYFYWHQENGPQLFGFDSKEQRQLFLTIISCSGLGPKIGLAVVGSMTPALFARSVTVGDVKALSSIDGIGPKKAETMIMQLRDKIAKLVAAGMFKEESGASQHFQKLSAVLDSLKYERREIARALEHISRMDNLDQYAFDDLVRSALVYLSKTSRG